MPCRATSQNPYQPNPELVVRSTRDGVFNRFVGSPNLTYAVSVRYCLVASVLVGAQGTGRPARAGRQLVKFMMPRRKCVDMRRNSSGSSADSSRRGGAPLADRRTGPVN